MFPQRITETTITKNGTDALYPKIPVARIMDDVSFSATLRALAHSRIFDDSCIRVRKTDIGYTKNSLERAGRSSIENAIHFSTDNSICIYNVINDGYYDSSLTFSTMNSGFQSYPECRRVFKFTEFFKKSMRAMLFVDDKARTSHIYVENLTLQKLHLVQVAIPVILPWYFQENTPLSEIELDLLKSLRDTTSDEYMRCLREFTKDLDIRECNIKAKLDGFGNAYIQNDIENVRENLRRNMDEIANHEDSINSLLLQRASYNTRLAGLQSRLNSKESENEIMEYFLHNKNLDVISADSPELKFICKGYVSYYDEDALRRSLENPRSNIYCSHFSNSDIKNLMEAIFIDETLRLQFCAMFTINLRGSVYVTQHGEYGSDYYDCMPNPHLDKYTCLGQHRSAIDKCIIDGNPIAAIEQCIASCKSLNFSDGTVVTAFIVNLELVENPCIELPDGKMVNAEEAIRWLNDQKHTRK